MTLLHVMEAPDREAHRSALGALEWEILRAEAQGYLDRVVARTGTSDVVAEGRLEEGPAPERISSLASQVGADLLVLATRGHGAAGSRIGGTAHKILELAGCSLLTVPVTDGSVPSETPPTRLLVPMDGSVRSLHVLPTVRRLAGALKADVVLTTLVTHPVRTDPFCGEEDFALANKMSDRLVRQAETYLTRIKSQLAASGVVAYTRVKRTTNQRSALVDLVRTEGVTLTVMSAHGSGCDPQRRFGTMASHFMEECECPLLMLQDLPRLKKRVGLRRDQRLPARSTDAVAGGV